MINRADNFSNSESVEEKTNRLLGLIASSPYHQMIKDGRQESANYRWIFISNYLKNVNEETGFDEIMNSTHFSREEKDFILFNMNRLKEIADWNCVRFFTEVKNLQKEDNDV